MTNVRIIRRKGNNVLVQWEDQNGVPQRSWLPQSALITVDEDNAKVLHPEHGVPASISWSKYVTMTATSIALEIELKRLNIWDFDDLDARPEAVQGAFLKLHSENLVSIRQARSNK
jgi:hypothetical protein